MKKARAALILTPEFWILNSCFYAPHRNHGSQEGGGQRSALSLDARATTCASVRATGA